jgi:hypothetical protein
MAYSTTVLEPENSTAQQDRKTVLHGKTLLQKPYCKTLPQNPTAKPYCKTLPQNHTAKPYSKTIQRNHTAKPYSKTIQQNHTA